MRALIAHVTDLHLNDVLAEHHQVDSHQNALRVLQDIAGKGISEAVVGGDVGTPSSQSSFFEIASKYGLNMRLTLGNHDGLEDLRRFPFVSSRARQDGLIFAEDLLGVSCIFLDSGSGSVCEAQLKWLEDGMRATSEPLIMLVHHPVLDWGDR